MPEPDVQQAFALSWESVAGARRFVASAVEGLPVDRHAAVLLASELATNAVKHANSEFRVRVQGSDRALRVEVINDAPELLAMVREPDEESGRGLQILQAIAQTWGVDERPGVKAVWFELPIQR